jgi:PIN domain nuclease of toxin-antitoxin system
VHPVDADIPAGPPRAVLLDTCAVIWLANRDPMTNSATTAIVNAGLAD